MVLNWIFYSNCMPTIDVWYLTCIRVTPLHYHITVKSEAIRSYLTSHLARIPASHHSAASKAPVCVSKPWCEDVSQSIWTSPASQWHSHTRPLHLLRLHITYKDDKMFSLLNRAAYHSSVTLVSLVSLLIPLVPAEICHFISTSATTQYLSVLSWTDLLVTCCIY